MTTQEQYIERLKEMVAAKFGQPITDVEGCRALMEAINEAVERPKISAAALELLYLPRLGKDAPRPTTLSALAKYVGYGSWSDFCTADDITPADDSDIIARPRHWGVIILTCIAVVVVIITAVVLLRGDNDTKEEGAIQPTVEKIDSRFVAVAEEWFASTTEHCLTIREYEQLDAASYAAHVEKVNAEYIALMDEGIRRDLIRYAAAHNITVDDATLSRTAEQISAQCRNICACLENE